MPTPWSPDVRALIRLLEDYGWHDYKEVVERLAEKMPPGRALRRYEERVAYRRERNGTTRYLSSPEEDEKILYGQRVLANVAFNSLRRRYLDIRVDDAGRKQIRLRPGAVPAPAQTDPDRPGGTPGTPEPFQEPTDERAGADEPVQDDASGAAAEDTEGGMAQAVDQEELLRRVVREELDEALAAFQGGLQLWWTEVVADLEHTMLTNCRGPRLPGLIRTPRLGGELPAVPPPPVP